MGYDTLNEQCRRILADGSSWAYGYDSRSQLASAVKSLPGVPDESFGYLYDDIGNRTSSTENGITRAYTANCLNQYTAVTNPSVAPTHDGDGNMTSDGEWTYTWNADNRLIAIENATHREEYDYDYMGRRWRLKTFTKSGSAWVLDSEKRFVYDGYRQIAEFTMNGTTPVLTASYLWQPGLDGIVLRATFGTAVRYFIPDGNRNVLQLRDATGAVTDSYAYGPFGQCAATGTTPNPFRFSCEYLDAATGLVYYNYRHYSPGFGRWLSRDFIDNISNILLYVFCKNKPIYLFDRLGLLSFAKRKNKREPKSVEIKVDKCTILVVYGHNYQNPAHDRHGYGVETVKNISAGSGANGCAHAAVLACFASLVPNSIPLPGYSPVNAKTYVTMFRGLMSTAEKEQFIDELLEMGFLVANDKEEAERILYAAQKTAAKMKNKPCCCKKVLLQLKTFDNNDAPTYINNKEL